MPPLVGVAVNVTEVPAQIAPCGLEVIFTVGVKIGFTNIFIVLEEAVVEARQLPPLIVISQVTVFPLARVEVVKVLEALF